MLLYQCVNCLDHALKNGYALPAFQRQQPGASYKPSWPRRTRFNARSSCKALRRARGKYAAKRSCATFESRGRVLSTHPVRHA